MVKSLYTSADMEKDISVTSDPVDGFQSVNLTVIKSNMKLGVMK